MTLPSDLDPALKRVLAETCLSEPLYRRAGPPSAIPEAARALEELGVGRLPESFRQYMTHFGGGVEGGLGSIILADVLEGPSTIGEMTASAREQWGWPVSRLVLHYDDGGIVVLDCDQDVVFDLGLEDLDNFETGRHPPRWPDFVSFLRALVQS